MTELSRLVKIQQLLEEQRSIENWLDLAQTKIAASSDGEYKKTYLSLMTDHQERLSEIRTELKQCKKEELK